MKLLLRIFFDIIIIVLVVFGWWYIALPLAIIGLYKFHNYIEILFFGILYDALFRMVEIMGIYGYVATISVLVIFGIFSVMKSKLRK